MLQSMVRHENAPIENIQVNAYRIPCDEGPESDGTLEWDATTLVLVEVSGGGQRGLGYTYADTATASLIHDTLRPILLENDALRVRARVSQLWHETRNLGAAGITAMAISAVDVALWDLLGKFVGVPTCVLLGQARPTAAIYGSGGFTSYDVPRLCEQLEHWVGGGIPRVKMKIGRDASADLERVRAARAAIGPHAELFVDANGAYTPTQAVAQAAGFAADRVTWFEEPVHRDDYAGTRYVRGHAPPGMQIASGEYGYALAEFGRMVDAEMLDVLQADATRCGGFSGLLSVDGLCSARHIPLSTHCAPNLHLHAALACRSLRHMEYFHDHARIEKMLFDGAADPRDGAIAPDLSRAGLGLDFKRRDAERFAL